MKEKPEELTEAIPLLLSNDRAAKYLGFSRSGWWRAKGMVTFPKPVMIPGTGMRWRKVDLDAWVEGMGQEAT